MGQPKGVDSEMSLTFNQLRDALDSAAAALGRVQSPADIEPSLVEVLDIIRDGSVSRNHTLGLLSEYVEHGRPGDWEIWQFLLHALKWPEAKILLHAKYEGCKTDPRNEPIVRHLLEACEDGWDDAEFYRLFRGAT